MRSILLHLHPAKVPAPALRFSRTFGLGGMAALLIVYLVITGVMLRFYYVPSPSEAYDSILFLTNTVVFGQFVRNIHYWSGVFLLLIAFSHLIRVFFTGAYRGDRRINWWLGLFMLLLVVLLNFTGYLLPWDQLAYWAIMVSTSILGYFPLLGNTLRTLVLGGNELTALTLLNFFTFHTAVFPVVLVCFSLYHFWRVRKAGGIILPETPEKTEMLPVMPHLVYREFVAGLALTALLLSVSAVFDAPLLDKANPAYSINPTKAPWYFAGVQELLMHFHPFFAAFIIPGGVIVMMAVLPWVKYEAEPTGRWFISEKGVRSAGAVALFAAAVTLAAILFNEYVLNFEMILRGIPAMISNGVIPLAILLIMGALFYRFYIRRMKLSRAELVQALFVFILVSFIVLTITGIFFRGKDMELDFPWNVLLLSE
jgi:quinol-cytochrome oxidoreductase complex cytochrome b subunit